MVPATLSIEAAGPISPYTPIRHKFSKQPLGRFPTHAKPTTARSLGQAPFRHSRNACRSSRTQATQIRAGFLSLFRPNKQTATDTAELVNELLDTASRTDGGAKASQDQRTKIRELVEQLHKAGGVRDPVYNDLIWGEYEVTYASKPQASGGPVLRSIPGRALFASQQLRQTLTPADNLVNSVSFKALGLFPGNAIQDAVIKTLSGSRYKLTLQPAKIYGIQLGPSREIERLFDVLYLDDKVRVVEFLPDGSPDSNSTQPVLFVMRRLSEVQHASSSMQTETNNQWQSALSTLQERIQSLAGGQQKSAGLATQAERKFNQELR